MKMYKKAFTHGGIFHADDVFSFALLKLVYPDIIVERGLTVPENYDGIVFDIGGGKFDHHSEVEYRSYGKSVAYASFGKLWREYGHMFLDDSGCRYVDDLLVQKIDWSDNGGKKDTLSMSIGFLNQTWQEEINPVDTKDFLEAVEIASVILKNVIKYAASHSAASQLIENTYCNSKNGIIVLEKYIPYRKFLSAHDDAMFVIYPSLRGGYNVQVIEDKYRTPHCSIPREWWGRTQDELVALTEIEGVKFCHQFGFLIATDTKESAIKMAEKCIKLQADEIDNALPF